MIGQWLDAGHVNDVRDAITAGPEGNLRKQGDLEVSKDLFRNPI